MPYVGFLKNGNKSILPFMRYNLKYHVILLHPLPRVSAILLTAVVFVDPGYTALRSRFYLNGQYIYISISICNWTLVKLLF